MSATLPIGTPQVNSIYNVFQSSDFIIPSYQRGYSWRHNQIEDLCDDLEMVMNGKFEFAHFFGQIVSLHEEDKDYLEVIDGQQRLTTSQLLISNIFHQAKKIEQEVKPISSETYEDVNEIKSVARKSLNHGRRVRINKSESEINDENVFEALLMHGQYDDSFTTYSRASENLINAYRQIKSWMERRLNNLSNPIDKSHEIIKISKAFGDKFYVTSISTSKRVDAFTIFQTLNSRGTELSSADIIKSYILSILNDNDDTSSLANDKWNTFSNMLDGDSAAITNYIRYYWMAYNQHVTVKELYRSVSKEIQTKEKAKEFLDDLVSLIPLYKYMSTAGTQAMRKKDYDNLYANKPVDELFSITNKIRFHSYYPIILAMGYHHIDESNVRRVMQKILSIFMRYSFISGRSIHLWETSISRIAQLIWQNKFTNIDSINNELENKLFLNHINPKSIETSFNDLMKQGGLQGPKKWELAYLFSILYMKDSFNDDWNDSYKFIFEKDNYELMRIGTFSRVPEYANYIGNWTIIEKSVVKQYNKNNDDRKLSNSVIDGIDNLHDVYEILSNSSQLSNNHKIANLIKKQNYNWNRENIIERQDNFSKFLVFWN